MPLEIERKFLVDKNKLPASTKTIKMVQGYIPSEVGTAVRLRLENELAKLTIKAKKSEMVRFEYEYEIPVQDAQEMLEELCEKPLVEKTRHIIPVGEHTWELDVFEGVNEGLVVAEIELSSVEEAFEKPAWITREVTDRKEYRNNFLAKQPYSTWTNEY